MYDGGYKFLYPSVLIFFFFLFIKTNLPYRLVWRRIVEKPHNGNRIWCVYARAKHETAVSSLVIKNGFTANEKWHCRTNLTATPNFHQVFTSYLIEAKYITLSFEGFMFKKKWSL